MNYLNIRRNYMAEKKFVPPIWTEPAHFADWVKWKEPRFKKAMETKYAKEWGSNKVGSVARADKMAGSNKTKYLRLGYTQNPRKVEMTKCGAATTKKRGPICGTRLSPVDADGLKKGYMDKCEISTSASSDPFCKPQGGKGIE
jgi:hypothetical protein